MATLICGLAIKLRITIFYLQFRHIAYSFNDKYENDDFMNQHYSLTSITTKKKEEQIVEYYYRMSPNQISNNPYHEYQNASFLFWIRFQSLIG